MLNLLKPALYKYLLDYLGDVAAEKKKQGKRYNADCPASLLESKGEAIY